MSEDFPSYEELEAKLWAVEHERDKYRKALERIAGICPSLDDIPPSIRIAREALEVKND